MPAFVMRCPRGHIFDLVRSIHKPAPKSCKCYHCTLRARRVWTPCANVSVSVGHIEGKFGRYDVKNYDKYAEECWPDPNAWKHGPNRLGSRG